MKWRRMAMEIALDQEIVNKTTGLLSILSKQDAFTIFSLAKDGLRAETDTPQKIGLTRKQYYTRLKQLVDAGLIDKAGDIYTHTTLGASVHQRHLLGLMEQLRNLKQLKMVDTLKRTRQFSEKEIAHFVGKFTGSAVTLTTSPAIEISWSYEDMVSAIVQRFEFCNREILLATRFMNEIIMNNVLRKAKSGVNVKVLADVSLLKPYIEMENRHLASNDTRSVDGLNAGGNPGSPGSVSRRLTKIPFCIIMLDGKEVGIELIDWNDPGKFNCLIFMKDENICRTLVDFYDKLWNGASEAVSPPLQTVSENVAGVVGNKFSELREGQQ